MSEQRKTIVWCAIITILSLLLNIFLEFEWDRLFIVWQTNFLTEHRDFIINTLTGICTGAFLSLLIARINYSAEKEKFIIEFSNLVEDFYTVCNELQYLYIRGDATLLAAYYREEYMNQKRPEVSKKHIARDNLLRSYKMNDKDCYEYMCLAEDSDTVDNELDSIVKNYNAVKEFDFSRIERILRRKNFIIPNNKEEQRIKEIYSYIENLYHEIEGKVEYWSEFCAKDELIIEIYRFQKSIFGNVKTCGTVIFLPPDNIAVNKIKEMLLSLNQRKGK